MKITVSNIRKSYHEFTVFKNINLQIETDDFMIITGKSGCGKTTLLKCLMGQEIIDDGIILYDDFPLNKNKDYLINQCVGYVSQENELIEEFTCLQNIHISLLMTGQDLDDLWFNTLVETLNIQSILNKHPSKCSVGECQRVALACALIKKPKVLFLDEPTGNLDETNTKHFIQLLKHFKEKMNLTILMVTHENSLLDEANQVIQFDSLSSSMPIPAKLPEKEIRAKKVKTKFGWELTALKAFYQFHLKKSLIFTLCIASIFIFLYLAIDASTALKSYIYHTALQSEDGKIIRVYSDQLISEADCQELLNIPHVESIQMQPSELLYAFERWEDSPISLTIDDITLSDHDEVLNFHGYEQANLILGEAVPEKTNLVFSLPLVNRLGYEPEEIIGKEISYQIPYTIGYKKMPYYELFYQTVIYAYFPETKLISLKGQVTGVVDGEYLDIYHDKQAISEIVTHQIKSEETPPGLISPFSQEEITVRADDIQFLTDILSTLRSRGYQCLNSVEYLINNLKNLDNMAMIYQFTMVFVLIISLFALKILICHFNSYKIILFKKLKHLGASTRQVKKIILMDGLYLFIETGIFSILLTWLSIPIFNRLFSYLNDMILTLQLEANNGIPLFNVSISHFILCILSVFVLLTLSSILLLYRCRRENIC